MSEVKNKTFANCGRIVSDIAGLIYVRLSWSTNRRTPLATGECRWRGPPRVCLDRKAMNAWRATKGWETRRRRARAKLTHAELPWEGGKVIVCVSTPKSFSVQAF